MIRFVCVLSLILNPSMAMIEEEGATTAPHAVLTVNDDAERLPFIDEQGQDVLESRTSRALSQQEQTCITDRCFMRTIASICCVGSTVFTLLFLHQKQYF